MGLYYFDMVWLSLSSMSNSECEIVWSMEDYCNPIICFLLDNFAGTKRGIKRVNPGA